jgi:hypothetical protein
MKRLLAVTIFAAIIITSVLNSSSAEEEKPLFTPCQYKASYNYYMSRGDQYMADSQLESAMESFQRALIIQPNSDEARRKIIMIKETLRAREEPRTEQVRKKAIAQAMRYAEEERPQPQLIVEPEKPKPAKEEPARISYKPKISEPRPQIKQKPSQAYPEPEAKKDSGLLPELFKQGKKEVKPEAIEQQPEKIELAQKYPTAPTEKKIKVSTAAPENPLLPRLISTL